MNKTSTGTSYQRVVPTVRMLLVLAVVIATVFSFAAIATAKYAGYIYDNPAAPGYISWGGAVEVMTLSGVDPALMATPHGGYTVNTTKCAVCHSAHRAATDATAAGIGSDWKLTPGGESCITCHTPHGANPIPTALVEWPSVYADGGPHRSFNCGGRCHGGVHGAGGSVYGTMNAFNLVGTNDAAVAAAFAAGNEWTLADSAANDAASGGGRGLVTEDMFTSYDYASVAGPKAATTQRALKAMATGYTCGPAGCHSSSQFAVNADGYAEFRAGDINQNSVLDTLFTGHLTNMTYGCPPCHMNDIAFYDWNYADIGRESDCGLCHDALGKATGSTAFPHANRGITMLETDDRIDWYDKEATSWNLWMYQGDATRRDAAGQPSATGSVSGARTLIEEAADDVGNLTDGMCLKCHAYRYGAHINGPGATAYNKADGTPTGNILDFSHF